MESCRLQILENILIAIQCNEHINESFKRDRRLSKDLLNRDLFVPVRGRRKTDQLSSISAEKKAKLDVLTNDLFVPNRGKRRLVRKHFLRVNPFEKRNNIELDMNEFFIPNRGKKELFSQNV
jgi:hypothetical protein